MAKPIEQLRKELLYKSAHRGCKETDILLGKYAESYIDTMDLDDLLNYKNIIEQADNDIYDWLTDKAVVPANINSSLINNIKQFHAKAFL